MTDYYLPIIMMSLILAVMLFTFLCSYKADKSNRHSQVQKIKYNIPQTPVTINKTINRHTMNYYSEDTINELR